MKEFEINIDFGQITVNAKGFEVVGSRMGKLGMGEESRSFAFDELVGFKLAEGNLMTRPHLAVEGPLGRTDLFFNKSQREDVDELLVAIRERSPKAEEGTVSRNLQIPEKGRAKVTEMQENLAEAGDRTNFMFGTYGKKMSSFEGVDLYEKAIKFNGKAWAISGAEISMEMGAPKSRMTLTRIGTGALLFGGTGAIVGGMSKKNKQKGFIEIITDDGGFVIEFAAKLEKKARTFTIELKSAARQ